LQPHVLAEIDIGASDTHTFILIISLRGIDLLYV